MSACAASSRPRVGFRLYRTHHSVFSRSQRSVGPLYLYLCDRATREHADFGAAPNTQLTPTPTHTLPHPGLVWPRAACQPQASTHQQQEGVRRQVVPGDAPSAHFTLDDLAGRGATRRISLAPAPLLATPPPAAPRHRNTPRILRSLLPMHPCRLPAVQRDAVGTRLAGGAPPCAGSASRARPCCVSAPH